MKGHSIALSSLLLAIPAATGEILLSPQDSWDFLLFKVNETAFDPASVDNDFHTTWQNPASGNYDGTAFQTGTGYFGYGSISSQTTTVNVWNPENNPLIDDEPPSGERNTVYFRSTFTPTAPVTNLKFSGVIDDGVVVYLDGAELTRFQMRSGADTWLLGASANGDEDFPSRFFAAIDLPANVPVTVAVSLHNSSSSSSDIGFGLEIESVVEELPPNDLFENAIEITGSLPLSVSGVSDNNIGGPGAFKEPGEPDHAGETGGASLWWKYTAVEDGRISISANATSLTSLLAVYTGESVDALTPVKRYPTFDAEASSIQDSELFFENARVEFSVEAGTTYYIAADGEDGNFGQINLTLEVGYSPLEPTALLLPAGSNWSHLIAVNESTEPVDPASLDPDFYPTWRDSAVYDGPAFFGPSPAPLGYGSVISALVQTNIWDAIDPDGPRLPETEERRAAYFRTTFTPEQSVRDLGFEGIFDDGAIIYINQVEVARINVTDTENADSWEVQATTPVVDDRPTETHAQYAIALDQNLLAGVPVEVAVSLHNDRFTSSDLGMDMRIFAMGIAADIDGFRASLTPGESAGTFSLTWDSTPGGQYLIQTSSNLQTPWSPESGPTVTGDVSGMNSEAVAPDGEALFYRVIRVAQ